MNHVQCAVVVMHLACEFDDSGLKPVKVLVVMDKKRTVRAPKVGSYGTRQLA